MEKIKETKTIEDIQDFFMRENLYKVMKSTLSMLLKGKDMDFRLEVQGGSYTDTEDVLVVGLLEDFYDLSYEELYIIILSLLGHERQHVFSTNINDYHDYINEEARKLLDKGIDFRFAREVVSSVGNIVEDGRIELILINEYLGYKDKIQFLNMHMWKAGGVSKDTDNLDVLISSMWSLSKLGTYTKNYEKYFLNTDIHKEVLKIESLVKIAHKKRTSKECFNVCRDIIEVIEPFILEIYEKLKDSVEKTEEFIKMLQEMIDEGNFGESEEMTNNSQKHSPHLTQRSSSTNSSDDDEEGDNQVGSTSGEEDGGDDEDNEGKDEGQSSGNSNGKDNEGDEYTQGENNSIKEDGDDEKNKENEDGQGKDDSSKEESKDENSQYDKGKEENEKEEEKKQENNKKESNKDKDAEESKDNEEKPDSKTNSKDEENDSRELSRGADAEEQEENKVSEDEINRKMKELFKDLEEESNRAFLKSTPKKKQSKEDDFSLTKEEKREAAQGACFREMANNFDLGHELPREIKVPAKKFKKEIEKIFINKSTVRTTGQKRGVINTEELYKIGMNNYNIFSVEGSKSSSDYVVYILQDGSGSMMGEKEVSSAYALSIIEEGLKGVVPFKLTTFKASRAEVKHFIIKDWKDKSKKSYSYNYLMNNSAGGGNEDGISIRVATKELLKRPEKDKVLIVLSDGLPSSIPDTKEAIEEARRSGIYLVGIMFGSDEFRINNYETYRAMYKTNIISTHPGGIPKKLTDTLKRILVR